MFYNTACLNKCIKSILYLDYISYYEVISKILNSLFGDELPLVVNSVSGIQIAKTSVIIKSIFFFFLSENKKHVFATISSHCAYRIALSFVWRGCILPFWKKNVFRVAYRRSL